MSAKRKNRSKSGSAGVAIKRTLRSYSTSTPSVASDPWRASFRSSANSAQVPPRSNAIVAEPSIDSDATDLDSEAEVDGEVFKILKSEPEVLHG